MSLPKELQELQDKRAKLEDEMQSLKEEQKKKEERAKALEEKIIEELNNKNEKSRQNISQLDSKIGDLERKLEQIGKDPEKQNLGPAEINAQINVSMLDEPIKEEATTVTVADSSSVPSERKDEELDQGIAKKKRRFL
jgi:predicted RNase H-like nuclease (RuvC/YqgF family)